MRGIFRIRIGIHYTWYLGFIVLTAVAESQLPVAYPLWQKIGLGLAGSAWFFVSIYVRQLIINAVALRARIQLRNVTLFLFGGVFHVPRRGTRPAAEFITALIGLLMTFGTAGVLYWLSLRQIGAGNGLTVLIQWMAFLWYLLALFHLVPAYPVDGGRILAAAMWKSSRVYERSVRTAAWIGFAFGVALAVGGILLLVFSHELANGALMAFIGWGLQSASAQVRRRAGLLQALEHRTAVNVMSKELIKVSPELRLGLVVQDYVVLTGHEYLAVAEEGKLLGILTVPDIKGVPKELWQSTTVHEAMTPVRKVRTVEAAESAADVLEQMDQWAEEEMPVLEKGELIGIVFKDGLLRLARVRATLGV